MDGINFGICKVTYSNSKHEFFVIPVDIFKSNIIKVLYRICTAAPAVNGKSIASVVATITAIQTGIFNIGRIADNDFVVICYALRYIAAVNITWYRAAADINSVIICFTGIWIAAANIVCYSTTVDVNNVVTSTEVIWIAAANIAYRTAADVNNVVVSASVGWPAAVNNACNRTAADVNNIMVSLAAFWSAAENVACYRTAADVNSVVVSADAIWPAAANYACYFSIAIDSYIAAAGIFIVIFVAITSAVNIEYFTAGNGETVSVAVDVIIFVI